jgi:magnesium chelatase family protein
MTLAITYSRANIGIFASLVTVETHITNGLPKFHMVGLPETVVKESKDRVRSAILNSHFDFPSRRITVNLAPADLPKHGGRYDLAIAMGILGASRQIPSNNYLHYEFAGELALSGELRAVSEILPFALSAQKTGTMLILPKENIEEAALIQGLILMPANDLLEVCSHFLGRKILDSYTASPHIATPPAYQDLKEVKGQHHAKRSLEIAAAGQHSILFLGPPGVGKTLLSHCLPGILPPLSESQAIELAAIQSVAGKKLNLQDWGVRPFRTPHHSASSYALIGGGNPPKPGEISLSHHGVLFLDELPEFKRQSLEALREPLESGTISISRASHQIQYPAKFQLIAAMNPCPCGQYGNAHNECICTQEAIKRYQARISGPLLDRIDIQSELQAVPSSLLTNNKLTEEPSSQVLQRVIQARAFQEERAGKPNALLTADEIRRYCVIDEKETLFLEETLTRMKVSARSFNKIVKLARTIADLEQSANINILHLKEAISFRYLDKMRMA